MPAVLSNAEVIVISSINGLLVHAGWVSSAWNWKGASGITDVVLLTKEGKNPATDQTGAGDGRDAGQSLRRRPVPFGIVVGTNSNRQIWRVAPTASAPEYGKPLRFPRRW